VMMMRTTVRGNPSRQSVQTGGSEDQAARVAARRRA